MKPLEKTHCIRGHLRVAENLKANGTCKTCERELAAIRRAKKALENPKPPKTHCRQGHPWIPENISANGACRLCYNERQARYNKAHPEARRSKKKRYMDKHPVARAKRAERAKAWRQANQETSLSYRRVADLKEKGWTPKMVKTTSYEQGGRCAICRQTPKPMGPKGGSGGLVPDHKHVVPPEPRSLLCGHCNSLIGFARENPEICRAAAEYLETWSGV